MVNITNHMLVEILCGTMYLGWCEASRPDLLVGLTIGLAVFAISVAASRLSAEQQPPAQSVLDE